LLIALLSSLPASAQNALSYPLADLYACQTIETVIGRNECYDHTTKALQNAEKQGAIITLKAEEFRKIHEGVFSYKHTPFTRRYLEDIANTTPTGTYKMALFNAKRRISNIKVRRIQ